MVKFTSLYSRLLSIKPKKTVERSIGTMNTTHEDCFYDEVKLSQEDLSNEPCSKSEGNNSNYSSQQDIGVHRSGKIRKSISLGSGLGREGMDYVESDSENEKRENYDETFTFVGAEPLAISPANQLQDFPFDLANNDFDYSIEDTPQFSKEGHDISYSHFSPPLMVKSKSLQNICSSPQRLAPRSRSAEDLTAFELKRTEVDCCITNKEENIDVNMAKGDHESCKHAGYSKDWIVPLNDTHFHGESSSHGCENLPSKDYKMKRIEDWVLGLQHCFPLEEINDDLTSLDNNWTLEGSIIMENSTSSKVNDKLNPGVEVAKRYISSLSPSATTAHLANYGLAVVPLLGAFVSLRTLNLSGNFIVKITAGALPRALHVLNLSKNSITVIEGLRELTRLRVLDLSYNRIVRIGHGLASCSSLKELYLAGNKISEIEGLHRLLKLNVLDLRYNKISTTKSFGQLAANYNSLQAVSFEGNPAQKNIGDENLKKHLQGLLPQLMYYNRHPIKAKALIDGSDRPARFTMSNRSLRSDHKSTRTKSVSSSRNHFALLPKPSKGKDVRLPPTGNKAVATHRNHIYDFGNKILGFGSNDLMRRSRSEGTLGTL